MGRVSSWRVIRTGDRFQTKKYGKVVVQYVVKNDELAVEGRSNNISEVRAVDSTGVTRKLLVKELGEIDEKK